MSFYDSTLYSGVLLLRMLFTLGRRHACNGAAHVIFTKPFVTYIQYGLNLYLERVRYELNYMKYLDKTFRITDLLYVYIKCIHIYHSKAAALFSLAAFVIQFIYRFSYS